MVAEKPVLKLPAASDVGPIDLVPGDLIKHVGAANEAWVRQFLQHQGISVVEDLTGGSGYRRVSWTVGVDEPLVETVLVGDGDDHVR